ncbi:alpha/beta hydrolase [Phaeodactylibacter xiamenensis]|uniref:alpha/beta hydrolase n=1 Tax=Phaeodactylibacter xiamenensis TaxID=1524460 RepID=UPI003CCC2F17
MIEEHHLSVQRTARYFTFGQCTEQTNCLVIACHGYGQLAKHFIKKFDVIARPDTLIVAPEGLSRFYWGGLSGNVVSSWMTKEDRLVEIADFSAYLTKLYIHFTADLPDGAQIILLGFSQGCATQLRWIARENPTFSHLILWAGSIPEDIDYGPVRHHFQDKPLHFVYGTEDPFITPERVAAQEALAAQLPMNYRVHTFEGKHTVEREALRGLFEQIRP